MFCTSVVFDERGMVMLAGRKQAMFEILYQTSGLHIGIEKTRRHGISAVSFEQCRRSGISADRSAFGDRGENNIVHLLSKLVASFWKLMTK
jgi:hypothetical protein